jgi:Uma2 family endonuclease
MAAYPKRQMNTRPRITSEEYLERERRAETRSEYRDGVIVAMAGATPDHNAVVFDITGVLSAQLRGKPCQGFTSDLRVRVPACNNYYYPDIVIACEEPKYERLKGMASLLNPTLIVEVLSDSTEATDRGEKWTCYQTLESLQTYVLVSQRQPLLEIYQRQENGWLYVAFTSLEGAVFLDAIGCELRLADVYARIQFPKPPDKTKDEPGDAEAAATP